MLHNMDRTELSNMIANYFDGSSSNKIQTPYMSFSYSDKTTIVICHPGGSENTIRQCIKALYIYLMNTSGIILNDIEIYRGYRDSIYLHIPERVIFNENTLEISLVNIYDKIYMPR